LNRNLHGLPTRFKVVGAIILRIAVTVQARHADHARVVRKLSRSPGELALLLAHAVFATSGALLVP
jgi:hypothetical protein